MVGHGGVGDGGVGGAEGFGLEGGCFGGGVAGSAAREGSEAGFVAFELPEDFGDVDVPGSHSLEAEAERGMVLGLVEVDQLSGDDHEGEKESEGGVAGTGEIWEYESLVVIPRDGTLRTVCFGAVRVDVA